MSDRELRKYGIIVARQCLMTRSKRIARKISSIYDQAIAPLGVTSTQLSVLTVTAITPGITPTEMADQLDTTSSTLSRVLGRMQDHGWIEIRPGHARTTHVHVTKAGAELYRQAKPLWEDAQEEARAHLREVADAMLERFPWPVDI